VRHAGRDRLAAELLPRCSFPPAGTAVACAVSGGADSLALLVLAGAAGLQATAIHVDHGLRPGSAGEAYVVQAAASMLGAGFRSVTVSVGEGPNLEARARAARYAALPPGVLTGHTADDQAETMLINLLRGAGLDGLAPMRSAARVGRPLLRLRRGETRALCAAAGFTPVADESNDDPRFVRNRVRHELLPLLTDIAGRDPVPILARQAALLGEEAAVLDALAAECDPTDVRVARELPPALLRRAVRAWLRAGDPEEHPPSAAEVERVLAVIRGDATACELGGGRTVRRSHGRLSIR
jgi:tRNA(Ile)-lysidine synthase